MLVWQLFAACSLLRLRALAAAAAAAVVIDAANILLALDLARLYASVELQVPRKSHEMPRKSPACPEKDACMT